MNRLRGITNPDARGFIIKWMFPGGIRVQQDPPIRVESQATIEIQSEYDRGAAVVKLDTGNEFDYHTVGLTLVPKPQDQ